MMFAYGYLAWLWAALAAPIDAGVCGHGSEAEIDRLAKNGGKVLAKWGGLIDANCDTPRELVAVRVWVESNGRQSATGDKRLGEAGLLSITSGYEKRIGARSGTRLTPAGNLALGCRRFHEDSDAVIRRWPHLDPREAHVFGQLPSAIGNGAASRLFAQVTPETYGDFLGYVTRLHAAGKLGRQGSQSGTKVLRRVRAVCVMGAAAKRMEAI